VNNSLNQPKPLARKGRARYVFSAPNKPRIAFGVQTERSLDFQWRMSGQGPDIVDFFPGCVQKASVPAFKVKQSVVCVGATVLERTTPKALGEVT